MGASSDSAGFNVSRYRFAILAFQWKATDVSHSAFINYLWIQKRLFECFTLVAAYGFLALRSFFKSFAINAFLNVLYFSFLCEAWVKGRISKETLNFKRDCYSCCLFIASQIFIIVKLGWKSQIAAFFCEKVIRNGRSYAKSETSPPIVCYFFIFWRWFLA